MNCKYCNSEIKLNVPYEWGDICELCRERLRDYAKAALIGVLSDQRRPEDLCVGSNKKLAQLSLAEYCYELADAMLRKERGIQQDKVDIICGKCGHKMEDILNGPYVEFVPRVKR